MKRRGTGVAFIAISAFLISTKYISAAIFGSGVTNWDEQLFNGMLDYVGNTLSNFSLWTLIIGIVYISWGEYDELKIEKNNSEE
ncbi:hypothetical protein DFP93_10417 [Aneurinibacillus soli]|uniref:Uncharacterized protein n=1 Tax=Aneurinibacillus soli TaxID=1500254 RepID=A0A0U4WDR2_9BACL|nr:hypothetical protein [Aneurinibacillus soli]PYE62373.1 hypothetical protein DFP93_10417 [Aneurinibacillus soli]BAU26936.1 hypothetical protein CB4_01105 [Aneurinibacillus soli]